jgi:hypothetical protein
MDSGLDLSWRTPATCSWWGRGPGGSPSGTWGAGGGNEVKTLSGNLRFEREGICPWELEIDGGGEGMGGTRLRHNNMQYL